MSTRRIRKMFRSMAFLAAVVCVSALLTLSMEFPSAPGGESSVFLPLILKQSAPPTAPPTPSAIRPLPDTWDGIHVFNDQLWLYDNPAWIEFSASHYVGTQKMTQGCSILWEMW
jgi:hypothetical protein